MRALEKLSAPQTAVKQAILAGLRSLLVHHTRNTHLTLRIISRGADAKFEAAFKYYAAAGSETSLPA